MYEISLKCLKQVMRNDTHTAEFNKQYRTDFSLCFPQNKTSSKNLTTTDRVAMECHFKMLKEKVLLFLFLALKLCIIFHCFVAERVKCEFWSQEQACRRLARSATLFIRPILIHKYGILFLTLIERKCKTTVRRAKIYCNHGNIRLL